MMPRIASLMVLLLSSTVLGSARANVKVEAPQLDQRVSMACNFLSSLYDQSIHLLRETSPGNTYYVASDNLLASKALETCNPSLSHSITAGLNNAACCQQGNDLMHESVLGRQIPLPIHTSNTYNVTSYWNTLFKTTGNYTVYWEYHNGTGVLSPYSYADVAAYTALEMNRRGNTTGTWEMLSVLSAMWDGKGMVDEPFKTGPGIYQTYKDALYLLVLTRLSQPIPTGLVDSILRMQGLDGGFHTGYSASSTYRN